MKIVRFTSKDIEQPGLGCLEEGTIYHITGNPLVACERGHYFAPAESVKLLAPCTPKKILAIAINFPGIDGYSPEMSEPIVFVKPGTCVCNPGDTVMNPFPELPWWGEAELGVVIKKHLKNVTTDQAKAGILGYTIGNDVTVENVENRDHHLARSKCPDNFCPIGPWIDTEFDASDCVIEAVQNGEIIRRGRTGEQVWQWPKIVSWLSSWITLEPWDVVLTGNPPDTVGMRFLKDGDQYTARIPGLGELTNYFHCHPAG